MATGSDIKQFLFEVDMEFDPPLSARVDIAGYAEKIAKNATVFSVQDRGKTIAMMAIYCNDPGGKESFMTLAVVLKEYRRSGIMTGLIEAAIRHLQGLRFKVLRLMVARRNERALILYQRLGFQITSESADSYQMELDIRARAPHDRS